MTNHIAIAETDVRAPIDEVWAALIDTDSLGRIMFDSTISTTWEPASPIVFSGEWQGTPFEDRGEVTTVTEPTLLAFTQRSGTDPATHAIQVELRQLGPATHVRLTQDRNASLEAAEHSAENWEAMLDRLRDEVERS